MSEGRFPRPYVNEVKRDDSLMEYTKFENNDIGARKAGMPKVISEGPKALEHVGQSASGAGGMKK